MRKLFSALALVWLLPLFAVSTGCTSTGSNPSDPGSEVLVGVAQRSDIEAAVPDWVRFQVGSEIDTDDARALASVPPGAEVTVYLGTWCSDSAREVPRLWRALDETGGLVPFEITWVGVGEEKKEPADLLAGVNLRYVPTFVVRRDGREVGRIVEESPHGIETDLLALLTGEADGVVTARDDADELAP